MPGPQRGSAAFVGGTLAKTLHLSPQSRATTPKNLGCAAFVGAASVAYLATSPPLLGCRTIKEQYDKSKSIKGLVENKTKDTDEGYELRLYE